MPQYRKLYVKSVESLDINDMPDDFTRLLWVLLPLGLDAEGRGLDNMSWIKSKVMPLREDVTPAMLEAAMKWYQNRGMIIRYDAGGRKYFTIPTWHIYQGDTTRETKSNYPSPNSRVTQELLTSKSGCNEYESVYESESELTDDKLRKLQQAFINASGITAYAPIDAEIYEKMDKHGVIPEDMGEAVRTLLSKKYTIKGIKSIEITAINIAKQRVAQPQDSRNVPTEVY